MPEDVPDSEQTGGPPGIVVRNGTSDTIRNGMLLNRNAPENIRQYCNIEPTT
jgi:hypothetical protein